LEVFFAEPARADRFGTWISAHTAYNIRHGISSL
jgi:hypothetical protein